MSYDPDRHFLAVVTYNHPSARRAIFAAGLSIGEHCEIVYPDDLENIEAEAEGDELNAMFSHYTTSVSGDHRNPAQRTRFNKILSALQRAGATPVEMTEVIEAGTRRRRRDDGGATDRREVQGEVPRLALVRDQSPA